MHARFFDSLSKYRLLEFPIQKQSEIDPNLKSNRGNRIRVFFRYPYACDHFA